MVKRQIGIDFGTSTSVIWYQDYDGSRTIQSEFISFDDNKYTPTLILLEGEVKDKRGKTKTCHECYGWKALNQSVFYMQLQSNFKMGLISADNETRVKSEELTKKFFTYLYKSYSDGCKENKADPPEITLTYVTCPGKFPTEVRKFLKETATGAGFTNVEVIEEAKAAIQYALTYDTNETKAFFKSHKDKRIKVMLVDMGAGTTDIAIFEIDASNIDSFTPISYYPKTGEHNFGGNEIERYLLKKYKSLLGNDICSKIVSNRDADLGERVLLVNLKEFKEIDVSTCLSEGRTLENGPAVLNTLIWELEDSEEINIDRESFEEMLTDYLPQFTELINGALEEVELQGRDIDLVLLTGGNSQWYFVKDILLHKTKLQIQPESILSFSSPQLVVAEGAGRYSEFTDRIQVKRQLSIDFGTTTTMMAYRDNKGEIQHVTIDNELYIPTLILEDDEGKADVFGKEAEGCSLVTGNLQYNFKTDLLSSDLTVFEKAGVLTEKFFDYLYQQYKCFESNELGKDTLNSTVNIVHTIVTYPGKFPDKGKDLVKNAAKKAGFPNVMMVTEAEAAMIYFMKYSSQTLNELIKKNDDRPLKIMMLDMGGGMMNITIFFLDVKKQILDQKPLLYPVNGNGASLGGNEIDELLTGFYVKCCNDLNLEIENNRRRVELNVRNYKETEIAKRLNRTEVVSVPQFIQLHETARIDQKEFETIIGTYLEEFPKIVNDALDEAEKAGKLENRDLDVVLLIGGNSQWYFVKKMLLDSNLICIPLIQEDPSRIIECAKDNMDDALTFVVKGAACYGKQPTTSPPPPPKPTNKYESVLQQYVHCLSDCFDIFQKGCQTKVQYCASNYACDPVCTVFDRDNCNKDTMYCHNYSGRCDEYVCDYHYTCFCDNDCYDCPDYMECRLDCG